MGGTKVGTGKDWVINEWFELNWICTETLYKVHWLHVIRVDLENELIKLKKLTTEGNELLGRENIHLLWHWGKLLKCSKAS